MFYYLYITFTLKEKSFENINYLLVWLHQDFLLYGSEIAVQSVKKIGLKSFWLHCTFKVYEFGYALKPK